MWFRIILFLFLIFIPQACARRDPAVESLIGSEPQRLSFGPPADVRRAFVEKMKLCWFSGSNSLMAGYHYETDERDDSESGEGYPEVKILDGGEGPVFEIQFHRYNENTLIVTRNVSLSDSLLTKVNRDIQLLPLAGPDCTS